MEDERELGSGRRDVSEKVAGDIVDIHRCQQNENREAEGLAQGAGGLRRNCRESVTRLSRLVRSFPLIHHWDDIYE